MTERLFDLTFYLAVPFWALMIFVPFWSWTQRIIGSPYIVVPPLVVWLVQLWPEFGSYATEMLSPDLDGVRGVVSTAVGTSAVWAHLIAFDLFVGRWMYLDSRSRGVHPLVMAPVLVLTILLSPIGLGAYLVLRVLPGIGRRTSAPGEQAVSVR
jgi:hypothetical protein